MNTRKLFFTLLVFSISVMAWGQVQKRALNFSDYDAWKYIEKKGISDDGNWAIYESNPYKGDGKLVVYNTKTNQKLEIPRAGNAHFSANSDFIAFKIYPRTDSLRALKLKKTDKEKLPKDSLGILILGNNNIIKVENIHSFDLAEKESSWMAYLYTFKELEDTSKKDAKKKAKKFDKDAPKDYRFVITNPVLNKTYEFKNITEFSISENGKLIGFVKQQNDSLLKSTPYLFHTDKGQLDSLESIMGIVKKLTTSHNGAQMAFIQSTDTVKTKVYSLQYWNNKLQKANKIIDTLSSAIPEKWTVSENGRIYFSDNDKRLFFGTALMPKPEPKDTLLDDEKVVLDLWSWTDPLLQPEQLSDLKDELKRSYLAVYHIDRNKVLQLEDETMRDIRISSKNTSEYGLGYNDQPYQKQRSWEAISYDDVYLVNIETGQKSLFKEKLRANARLSAEGKYIYWYSYDDKSWYAYSIKDKSTKNLTGQLTVNFFDEENDYPMDASPYGVSGWAKNDQYVLINDKFDIWQIDPTMKNPPLNLTNGFGRKNNISFNYVNLDYENDFINPKKSLLLKAFNFTNKQAGFYKTMLNAKTAPEKLLMGDYYYFTPIKAANADRLIWQKSSFKEFYDLWTSSLDFKNTVKFSDENPQQKDYLWGDVELVKWITPDGTKEEGLLYKPENFDPNKKYPMIVYFYRLHSDEIHDYYVPKPSRSTINPSFYVSNGYFVFMPNIRFKIGYPGESSYNYVVSGTLALLNERPYIDKNALGIQGQSWGGYQAGFIITKTDLFAAASIGAPVSNMTSAYGGIRWESGMSRMFQYENSQSRIGGTLWEKPLNYIENSPVFYAPKVNTPVLIRHNDGDGAVPWYQGIEYFVALRRLNKPVWMLNYNGQPHNEKYKSPNTKDLSIRMMQFFDHYLKGKPTPVWMTEGIPATKKGKTMGYELNKK